MGEKNAAKKPPIVRDSTPERDAKIRAQIASDPDMWEIKPGTQVLRRGRPKGLTKQQVTLRLDNDLMDRLKAGGKGWQTRINTILRDAMGM